jgi:Spy/CpxP family protein refolding chaperone
MEEIMKKYVIVIISVLMSVSVALPLTLNADRGMQGKDKIGEGMKMGGWHHDWRSNLNLDDDILQKIQEMRLKNKEKMLDLKNQIEKKELEMEKVLLEKKLDLNKILSIHDEIAALRQKISRKMLENKIEMYKLIPDDKKEEARKIFMHKFLRKGHGKFGKHERRENPGCPAKK